MHNRGMLSRTSASGLAAIVAALGIVCVPVSAQQAPGGWQTGVEAPAVQKQPPPAAKSPETPNTDGGNDAPGQLRLEALLTSDGQRIDQGLIWRVFSEKAGADGKSKLVETSREAAPQLKVPPGDYIVNVAFGRANLTRKVSVKGGAAASERFVLNAGGLRLTAHVGNAEAPPKSVSYQILSDERDQLGNRNRIMTGARPGLIIRLNAGIYQIVSTYGDANAVVRSDVTVEAGKLTEATVTHAAARVTFKLVNRAGGEAIADTQWTLLTGQGELVKESVGALPTHILAPGSYIAVAKSGGNSYRREFQVGNGDTTQVEVLVR